MDDSGPVRHVKFESNFRWLLIRYRPLGAYDSRGWEMDVARLVNSLLATCRQRGDVERSKSSACDRVEIVSRSLLKRINGRLGECGEYWSGVPISTTARFADGNSSFWNSL
jgi:hypothetical protein